MSKTIYLTPKGKYWVNEIRVLMALGKSPEQAADLVLRRGCSGFGQEPEPQRRASAKVFAALAKMDAQILAE